MTETAIRSKMDCIITRNKKDYTKAEIGTAIRQSRSIFNDSYCNYLSIFKTINQMKDKLVKQLVRMLGDYQFISHT